MRVSILFSRTPMRRPSRVAETELPRYRLPRKKLFEIFELAGRTTDFQLSIFNNRNAGGVIASILEGLQASHNDRHWITRAHISENSTHRVTEYQRDEISR